ncbi:MAG: ribosome maturation factor [Bacteroidota bacterium]
MDIEQIEQQLRQIIENQHPGVFVVDIQLKEGKATTLLIKVDTDQGISLDQCARISRALGAELEENEWIDVAYRLEVSSPGVGYPLKLHRQYLQNIGRKLRIIQTDLTEVRGKLGEVTETSLTLEPFQTKGPKKKQQRSTFREPITIDFSTIREATVFI